MSQRERCYNSKNAGRPALVVTALCMAIVASPSRGANEPVPPAVSRVDALLAKMTLEEKLGQLTQQWGGVSDEGPDGDSKQAEYATLLREGKVGSFIAAHGAEYTNQLQKIAVEESRLGVPVLFANDVIHGYQTIFPIPLGQGASWDPGLAERCARVAAREASAAGTRWTFAPMVDVARDPRWGRIAEGYGEDPHLTSAMAAAKVRGFQGDDLLKPDTILACPKHFVAYGGAEGGRDYNTVDISEQTLREVHLPAFHSAVRAGAATIMSSFNEISGVPASANPLTLRRILRQEWGFDGLVVSDWGSVEELVAHGFAADSADAVCKAILAGVDMDMSSLKYRTHLAELVRQGRVPEAAVDRAVRYVLMAKQRVGLFDDPYTDPKREPAVMLCKENRALAREAACRSMVLLRNENNVLPLKRDLASLAVIGPLAENRRDPLGTWAGIGDPDQVVTVLAGIKERVSSSTKVTYAKGCEIENAVEGGIEEAVNAAKQCEVAVLVVGEAEWMSGEGRCRSTLDLPAAQQALVEAVHGTGVPTVVVLLNGRPLSIGWIAENVPGILEAWHPGTECGHAIADVLFGDVNPGGKLPVTFPRSVGQVPIYYNHKNTGRPPSEKPFTSKYLDLPSTPLFPFGHGLSYTTFAYSNLRVSPKTIGPHGRVEVTVDVSNSGTREGDEIVQLYIRDVVGSMTRPVKQLKGFRRITLKPGETRTLTFTLSREHLGFYNRYVEYVVEPGTFTVWVGPSSVDGLEATFEVVAR